MPSSRAQASRHPSSLAESDSPSPDQLPVHLRTRARLPTILFSLGLISIRVSSCVFFLLPHRSKDGADLSGRVFVGLVQSGAESQSESNSQNTGQIGELLKSKVLFIIT